MPDPHQLIFTHFPNDKNWQLLERPITLAEFETLVSVKSAFFKYGLQVVDHREVVIVVRDEVTVRIRCPAVKVRIANVGGLSIRETINIM
jgi:transglutaminase/protease-like cytokinesis protein 3